MAVVPYVVGVLTAPLVGKVLRSVVGATVKATVGVALQAKKVATEAVEDLQDISAEVNASLANKEAATGQAREVAEAATAATGSKSGTRAGGGARIS